MVLFGKVVEATRGLVLEDGEIAPAHKSGAAVATVGRETRRASECIAACNECRAACLEIVGYSIRMQGYYAELGHVRLLEDTARLCEATVDFLLRGSEMSPHVRGLCAELCRRCARDCDRFDYDQRLLTCAETCRRCAEACESLEA